MFDVINPSMPTDNRTSNGRPGARSYPQAIFPGGVASASQLAVATNSLQTQLVVACQPSDGAIAVQNIAGITQGSLLSIDAEIVMVTAPPTGNACIVQRGFDGTMPAAHAINAQVSGFIDAWHHNALAAEVIAIENVLGSAPIPLLRYWQVEDYSWTQNLSPQSLAGGSNNITLQVVPRGIKAGSNVYISDSSLSEVVNITALVGNVATINCIHAHASGAWLIGSATAGIQETINVAAAAGGGLVQLMRGDAAINDTIYVPDQAPLTIQGYGFFSSNITVPGGFAGDVFQTANVSQAGCFVTWRGFSIRGAGNHPSGAGIHIINNTAGYPIIEDVYMSNLYQHVVIDGSFYVTINKLTVFQYLYTVKPHSGVFINRTIRGCPSFKMINSHIQCQSYTDPGMMSYGLLANDVDGLWVDNCSIMGDVGIGLICGDQHNIGSANIANCEIDSCRTKALEINGTGTPLGFDGNIRIIGCHLIATYVSYDTTYGAGILIAKAQNVLLEGNWIGNFRHHGIIVFGTDGVQIQNNVIFDNGRDPATANACGINLFNCRRFLVTGNIIQDDQPAHTQNYAITYGGDPLDGQIANNKFWSKDGGQAAFLNNSYTIGTGQLQILNNHGYNPVGPSYGALGTSPFTYTAGPSPETFSIMGGTSVVVSKNGVNVLGGAGQVQLAPNEAIVITYSGTPTVSVDVH